MQTDMQAHIRRFKHYGSINIILAVLFVMLFMLSLSIGTVSVPLMDTLRVLAAKITGRLDMDAAIQTYSLIINDIRLPRVITAALVGAALASSGCAMQGLLKNPLADGSILGISAGGTLGAVLAVSLGAVLPPMVAGLGPAVFSILFSFLSLMLVLTIAWRFDKGFVTNTIILLGIVFSMLASSITSLLIAFSGNNVEHLLFWLMGSLTAAKGSNVLWLSLVCASGVVILLLRSNELNAFALGEEQAGYLGVNTKSVKLQIMVAVAVLIGASVSVSGMIGFVGLIPPHIMRLFVGSNHKRLLPSSALFGASFLMLADLISRTAVRPIEIPIGIVTSFAGSILFLYLFNSMRGRAAG